MLKSKLEQQEESKISLVKVFIQALGIGLLSGFIGSGGGFMLVPLIYYQFGLKMQVAVGSSLLIISLKSLLGFFTDLNLFNQIDWTFILSFSILPILGIMIGAQCSSRIDEKELKRYFAYFVLITGSLMLGAQILRLLT